jgi:ABC-type transport system involved in cytochrome bd biosynthesis fused ATPase/permease subunit
LDLLSEVRASTVASTSDSLVRAIDLETTASATPLNLDLRPTSRTLVTGPSGSGKTTLLDTLLGWREPLAGTVARTSSRVGHVSAESELFAGSLWDNVTLGADLDEHHVRQLLADLSLSGARFEDLTAPLLADGRGLSSGERVRLVLARCLLADPALLVIDDVAGVLDGSARDAIIRVLDRHPQLAIIEATVDTPLLHDTLVRIEIHP